MWIDNVKLFDWCRPDGLSRTISDIRNSIDYLVAPIQQRINMPNKVFARYYYSCPKQRILFKVDEMLQLASLYNIKITKYKGDFWNYDDMCLYDTTHKAFFVNEDVWQWLKQSLHPNSLSWVYYKYSLMGIERPYISVA